MGRRSKQPAKKQQPITLHALPLLKKPLEQIGKQINVPGSYWEGRMSADERSTLYKCSVRDFTQMHKFPGEQAPRAAFQLQEMGVAGTGSTEQGDSSGEVFWMPYSPTFLGFFYETFPEMMPQPNKETGGPGGQQSAEADATEGASKRSERSSQMSWQKAPEFPRGRRPSRTYYS